MRATKASDPERIGRTLRRLRHRQFGRVRGSMESFAKRCALLRTNIHRLERGQCVPTVYTLAVCVEALGMTMSEFWAEVERGEADANGSVHCLPGCDCGQQARAAR